MIRHNDNRYSTPRRSIGRDITRKSEVILSRDVFTCFNYKYFQLQGWILCHHVTAKPGDFHFNFLHSTVTLSLISFNYFQIADIIFLFSKLILIHLFSTQDIRQTAYKGFSLYVHVMNLQCQQEAVEDLHEGHALERETDRDTQAQLLYFL